MSCMSMHGATFAVYPLSRAMTQVLQGCAEITCVCTMLQTTNAKERMVATFVEGTDLGVGSGGAANTQDLVRMLLWARISCGLDSKRATQLMSEDDAQALRPGQPPLISNVFCSREPNPLAVQVIDWASRCSASKALEPG